VRLGLISDLHGNRLAFEAVLEDLEKAGIDRLVCLGDVAAGPEPRATIERLRDLGCPVVVGNWDCWLVEGMPHLPGEEGPKLRDQGDWSAAQLGETEQAFLAELPPYVEVNLDGAEVLCVHGSPRSNTDDIQATTPDDELAEMLAGSEPAFLAAGHTHVQLARQHGSTLIVNPGSVGLPFNRWPPNGAVRVSPWAEYAILTINSRLISTELRRVSYDISALLDVARESGMPHTEWWAAQWVTAARA
jgi:putative phosphoesterase